jgi:hypothetical protein
VFSVSAGAVVGSTGAVVASADAGSAGAAVGSAAGALPQLASTTISPIRSATLATHLLPLNVIAFSPHHMVGVSFVMTMQSILCFFYFCKKKVIKMFLMLKHTFAEMPYMVLLRFLMRENATTYMCISVWRCGTNDGAIVSLINPAS